MKRQMNIEDISENNLYDENDMARIGCNDCQGCSECCRFAADTIILDPSDIYRLCQGLQMTFNEMNGKYIGLKVVDGLTLPFLIIDEEKGCRLLSNEGRCTIHNYRPGNCRLFPLGRIYEKGDFKYFIQKDECVSPLRVKVKISKWLGLGQLDKYRIFLNKWHYMLKDIEEKLPTLDFEMQKKIMLVLLQVFFVEPYDATEDFYGQFDVRYDKFKSILV